MLKARGGIGRGDPRCALTIAEGCLVCETCKMPRANICESPVSYPLLSLKRPRFAVLPRATAVATLLLNSRSNDKGLIMDILYLARREEFGMDSVDGHFGGLLTVMYMYKNAVQKFGEATDVHVFFRFLR